jgi:tripartite-type tricarboxylate transporter receptor subunit TctC
MKINIATGLAAAALGTALLAAGPASAADPFYKGKTIQFQVGSGQGGTYSVYARGLIPYLQKYIAGNPTIVPQFNPRGGGRQVAAFVSNAAPKDGTVMSMVQQNVPVYFVLNPKGIKFDVSKWQWIGRIATAGSALGVWSKAPATTWEGMKSKEIVLGATGTSSETFMTPTMANKMLGTKFKIVKGYRGSRPLFKAIESGEIHAFALSYKSWNSMRPDWGKTGQVKYIMQTGLEPDPALGDVPLMWKQGKTELDRQAMKLAASSELMGRAIWFPAGVPQARVDEMRVAFAKAISDPGFAAAMAKSDLPIHPASGDSLQKSAKALFNSDPKVVAWAKSALGYK